MWNVGKETHDETELQELGADYSDRRHGCGSNGGVDGGADRLWRLRILGNESMADHPVGNDLAT